MKKPYLKYIKNKRISIITSLFLLVGIIWLIWGNTHIQVSRFTIESEEIPENFSGYKIVHISDTHDSYSGNRLTPIISKELPDSIVITGDLIDARTTNLDETMNFIRAMTVIAPVYYVTGNHEARNDLNQELEEKLIAQEVIVLNDEKVMLERAGEEIQLSGVRDPLFSVDSGLISEETADMKVRIEELLKESEGYNIVLSHRPEMFDTYVETKANIVFSGHAHGGQIRLPFIGGLFAPGQGFFPEYTSGVYHERNTHMIVSRGLGNSLFPLRVNNNPEVVVIELEMGQSLRE